MFRKMKNVVSFSYKDPVQDGEYNYHDSLVYLVEGILTVGA